MEAHPLKPQVAQHQPGMGRPMARLAIEQHLLCRIVHPGGSEYPAQCRFRQQEAPVAVQYRRPLKPDGSRQVSPGACQGQAPEFPPAAGIQYHHIGALFF